MADNVLYYGDNLEIMRRYVSDASVDLVYLDPPFNSNADYNVLFTEHDGAKSDAQVQAFVDTWHWDIAAEYAFREVAARGDRLSILLDALRRGLGSSDMMAYLTMMAVRLIELRRVLKPSGSIYLHCDPTASHYLKILLDAVCDARNFRNEIVWKRSHPHGNVTRTYGDIHDVILFYSKGNDYLWRKPHKPYLQADGQLSPEIAEQVLGQYNHVEDGTGRRFQATSLLNPDPNRPNLTYEFHGHTRVWRWTRERMAQAEKDGRLYFPRSGDGVPREKRYLDEQEGWPLQDIWTDVPPISALAAERLGYPTQKPEALLERIIEASSGEGDTVLDPFCGCGTTVAVAERLHRRWIGIDITHLAITLMKKRLVDTFGPSLRPYETIGEPQDLPSARALALDNRYQFQYWALGLVGARPVGDTKKGADRGVDGQIVFFDDDSGRAKRVVISVKSGHTTAAQVRDLKGVLEREQAEIGAFITLEEPSRPMRTEASEAGLYQPASLLPPVPKLQLLTIEALLEGQERLEYPQVQVATFRRAPRQTKARKSAPPHD